MTPAALGVKIAMEDKKISICENSTENSTRSSSLVSLNRPSNKFRLKITNRSFYLAAPALWNCGTVCLLTSVIVFISLYFST
jgi:hypothetical protein